MRTVYTVNLSQLKKNKNQKTTHGMQDVQLLREGGCKTVRVIACLIQRMLFTAS